MQADPFRSLMRRARAELPIPPRALGTQVTWETVGDSIDGKRVQTVVRARSTSRTDVEVSDPIETTADTGTRFIGEGKESLDPRDPDEPVVSAKATAGNPAITDPTPSATASAPTRPTPRLRPALNP